MGKAENLDSSYQVEVADGWLKRLKDDILDPETLRTVNHPFLRGLEAGTLPVERVRRYFSDLEWVTAGVSLYVAALASRGDRYNHALNERLIQNAYEECSHPFIHKKMMIALGSTDAQAIYDGPEWVGYEATDVAIQLRLAIKCCCYVEEYAIGFAGLAIGIESGAPRIFGRVADALIKHYGLSEDDVEWLRIHTGEVEIEHGNAGLRLLGTMISESDINSQNACRAIVKTLSSGFGTRLMDASMMES